MRIRSCRWVFPVVGLACLAIACRECESKPGAATPASPSLSQRIVKPDRLTNVVALDQQGCQVTVETSERVLKRIDLRTGVVRPEPSSRTNRPDFRHKLETVRVTDLREQIRSPDGYFLRSVSHGKQSTVIASDRYGHSFMVLSTRVPRNSDTFYHFARWSPSLSWALIVQDMEPHGAMSDSRVYIYDRALKKAIAVAQGDLVSASGITDDRVCFVLVERFSLDSDLWRSGAAGCVFVYKAGAGKPMARLPRVRMWSSSYEAALALSPDCSRLAVAQLVKDRFGEYGDYALQIVDLRAGRVRTLVTAREVEPPFAWVDNHRIAYTTYDRFEIPNLWLADVLSGNRRRLLSDPAVATIAPLACVNKLHALLYVTSSELPLVNGSRTYRESLWTINLDGGRPAKVYPR
jgi:hypothetical protein